MSRPLPLRGFRGYLVALVAVVAFPLLWMRALGFARRQQDVDPRARGKVLAAIGASVVILAVGILGIQSFRDDAVDGIYANLDQRLVAATGEQEVRENEETVRGREDALAAGARNRQAVLTAYEANRSALPLDGEAGAEVRLAERAWADLRNLQDLDASAAGSLPTARRAALHEAAGETRRLQDAAVPSYEAMRDAQGAAASLQQRVDDLSATDDRSEAEEATLLRARADLASARLAAREAEARHGQALERLAAARAAETRLREEAATQAGLLDQRRQLVQRIDDALEDLPNADDAQRMGLSRQAQLQMALDSSLSRASSGAEAASQAAREHATRAFALGAAAETSQADAAAAALRMEELAENRRLYEQEIQPAIRSRDDARLRAALAGTSVTYTSGGRDLATASSRALEIKDKAVADMDRMLLLFAYPSLAGLFFAPLVLALGSILRASYVPSPTVGFRPYPVWSATLFLALGGFGLPSIPFAAWALKDIEMRAAEGQIAL